MLIAHDDCFKQLIPSVISKENGIYSVRLYVESQETNETIKYISLARTLVTMSMANYSIPEEKSISAFITREKQKTVLPVPSSPQELNEDVDVDDDVAELEEIMTSHMFADWFCPTDASQNSPLDYKKVPEIQASTENKPAESKASTSNKRLPNEQLSQKKNQLEKINGITKNPLTRKEKLLKAIESAKQAEHVNKESDGEKIDDSSNDPAKRDEVNKEYKLLPEDLDFSQEVTGEPLYFDPMDIPEEEDLEEITDMNDDNLMLF